MIYFNDKKEKEPFGLLVGLFFGGVGSVVTALIGEEIGGLIIPEDTLVGGILHAMIVVGPSEELSKFLVLFLITWKNRHFNYSYDAIVYAVFVSLGFAAIENIGYVFIFGKKKKKTRASVLCSLSSPCSYRSFSTASSTRS